MAFKPYGVHTSYDLHYLRIANEIYNRLFGAKHKLSFVPNIPEPKMLACIIASYYEDYVCEIGIWRAFTSYNKELYGYYLPFYESEQYDPGYINPEDISYLLWHFFSKWNNTFFAPDYPMFSVQGRMIYEYLEPLLDDALDTDFYSRFFTVKGDEYFFDVKERLKWFAEGSYLFAADLNFARKEELKQALKEDNFGYYDADPGKFLYMILEEYIYRRRCSFSALNAPEFFARVCRSTEPVRQDIAGLAERHFSTFECKEETKKYFIFENIQTSREYTVRKDSFQQSSTIEIKGKIALLALVQWQGEWWMTGAAAFYGKSKEGIREVRKQMITSPFLRTAEQMQRVSEAVEKQYQVFVEHFGGPLATFTSRQAANEAMRNFYKTYRDQILEENPEYKGTAPPPLEGNLIGDISESGGIGLFFNRPEGVIIVSRILENIQFLEQKEPLEQEESESLFESMTNYNPALLEYLLKHYPTHNIRIPVAGCKTDLMKYIWFVNRFEHPGDFGKVSPSITLMDREVWGEGE